jgi:hypothetical protein
MSTSTLVGSGGFARLGQGKGMDEDGERNEDEIMNDDCVGVGSGMAVWAEI